MGCGEKKAAARRSHGGGGEVVRVPIVREWVGATDGLVNAKINAQVQGYLIKQNYQEGSVVKKGQVLFEIDPRPFQAALEQAKGELAIAEGQLYTAKANLEKIRPLAAVNAVSKKDLDDAIGREASSKAAVQAGKAAVRKAEIDLSFTRITSPIEGIAGIAKVTGGFGGEPGWSGADHRVHG
jgi:membrane fusion protein (multidrug efflux system)